MNARSRIVIALSVIGLGLGAGGAHAAPCELVTPRACYERGVELFKAAEAEAAGFFERACESGEAEGCTELGFMLMEGMLVARDDARSLKASLRACELGSGLGCNNAFVMVRDGRGTAAGGDTARRGIKRDDMELRRLADRACALDDAEGCFLAAAVHGEPLGGALDQKRSNEALDKSCKLGFGMACSVVAHRLLEGSFGYARDEMRGVRMMARACENASGDACNVVGSWTLAGEHGLVRDVDNALGLFARACELEDQDGCKNEKQLREKTAAGTLSAKLVRRSSKRVLLSLGEGDAPPVGALGEVAKQVNTLGMEMSLTLAKVVVRRVEGRTLELEVTEDLAIITIDGKQVDHWKPAATVTLTWQRAAPTP